MKVMEDSNKRQRQYASSLQISVKGSQQSHHNQVFILNLKTILDIVPLFIPLCLIIDRHLQCTLFWPPDACLLHHNDNNNNNDNSNDNNKVNRCLARYCPRATITNRPTNRRDRCAQSEVSHSISLVKS